MAKRGHIVQVLMPDDLVRAINKEVERSGRPSASDLIRVILRHYLIDRQIEIPKRRLTHIQEINEARRKLRHWKANHKVVRTSLKNIYVPGQPLEREPDDRDLADAGF